MAVAEPNPPPVKPLVEAMHWQRRPGEIAARLRASNLAGGGSDLFIESDTTAVILQDGAITEQHGPGTHKLGQGWWARLVGGRQDTSVVLIDNGEIGLEFTLADLWTMDPLRLAATCRIAVQVNDTGKFVRSVMKDRAVVTVSDLRDLIYPELRDAAQVYVADHSMEQLDQGLASRRDDFGVDVRERMRSLFAQMGVEFLRVQMFDLRHPRLDQLRQTEEDLFLGPVDLHHKKRLLDQFTEEQLLEIAREEANAANAEKRNAIRKRVERMAQEDRIGQIRNEAEFARFMAEMDREKLLREDELAQLRESLLWQGDDRQQQRARVIAVTQLQSEFELKQMRLEKEFAHDQARLKNELALVRDETFGRIEIERRKQEFELEREAAKAAQAREQGRLDSIVAREKLLQDELVRLQIALASVQNEFEAAQLRVRIERMEDDNDLLTVEKAQAMMRRNREEKRRIDREDWIEVQIKEIEFEERRFRMRIEERRLEMAHEMERIKTVGALPLEGQIAWVDLEKAGLIAELLKLREFKNYSPEQLELMVAEKQPAVVEAIKARYQAAMSGQATAGEAEKWKLLAEERQRTEDERRKQAQEQLDRQERQNREAAERQERLASKALDSATDIAKAFAQKPDAGPTIFVAGGATGVSTPGATAVGGSSEVQVCPRCRVKSPVGEQFCSNCGYRFYEA